MQYRRTNVNCESCQPLSADCLCRKKPRRVLKNLNFRKNVSLALRKERGTTQCLSTHQKNRNNSTCLCEIMISLKILKSAMLERTSKISLPSTSSFRSLRQKLSALIESPREQKGKGTQDNTDSFKKNNYTSISIKSSMENPSTAFFSDSLRCVSTSDI